MGPTNPNPRSKETFVHTKTCTFMFIAALSMMTKYQENSHVLQQGNGQTNHGVPIWGNAPQLKKND